MQTTAVSGFISIVDLLLNLVIPAVGAFGIFRFIRWVRAQGGFSFFLRLLLQGYQSGLAGGARAAHPHHRPHPHRRVTVEEVAEALSKLPTERFATPEQLAAMPVHDLKALLHGRGLQPPKCCVEKGELVRMLLEQGGSSADSCSICCEEYAEAAAAAAAERAQRRAKAAAAAGAAEAAAGGAEGKAEGEEQRRQEQQRAAEEEDEEEEDAAVVLRVLRCGHRFHVECVDKWFLSATDYTRLPACPLCNTPLIEPQAQPAAQQGAQQGAQQAQHGQAQAQRAAH
ncbi:hypothetical protein HYH03_000878 [Edaphochlamys debaryana]|uniref:RING-type domain-containing protein n=1 Tax=Edaphochlamys debaryana TaxID=47281 RepID=A0A835YG01_9CHLO|nr:hypothetical protein HYH03_000878 [Edaphochlamys debaryana]|eukprot:KAG2501059.1 hypothetical protein HYH03_000878 [Edaphochlamys debaryana]